MAVKRGTEIPTIDVAMVTIQEYGEDKDELILDTANQIQVTVATETVDKVPLIVKGVLISQKPQVVTVTGNTIVMTDNVFNPELVEILQGGVITKDVTGKFTSYTPPLVGEKNQGKIFKLNAYSAIYSAAGTITGYEKIQYPNCTGTPVALNSTDGVFRAPEYTINSAPSNGEAPYTLAIVDELPVVTPVEP